MKTKKQIEDELEEWRKECDMPWNYGGMVIATHHQAQKEAIDRFRKMLIELGAN